MRFRKVVRRVAVIAAPIILVAVGYGLIRIGGIYTDAASTLPSEMQAARQEGIPLTEADLARNPPVPDADNAAFYYRQMKVIELTKSEDQSVDAVEFWKGTARDREVAGRVLKTAAIELQLAEQAAAMPDCDFHRRWSMDGDFQEFAGIRHTAWLLALQADLAFDAGQPEKALHSIAVAARFADHEGHDSSLTGLSLQMYIESMLDRKFIRIVTKYADRPAVLKQAIKTEEAFGDEPDFRRALDGAVVNGRCLIEYIRTHPGEYFGHARGPFALQVAANIVCSAYEANGIAYVRKVYRIVAQCRGDYMTLSTRLKELEAAQERIVYTPEGQTRVGHELDDLLEPHASTTAWKLVDFTARRRLRTTLIALLAYRAAHGVFPVTLAMLNPAAPLDPYIHLPLHYRRTKQGFVLYSVGENLKDDGGNGTPPKRGDPRPDIVIEYPYHP